MNIPSIGLLFKKQQVSHAAQLILSRNPVVRHCSTQKTLSEQQKQHLSFKPMVVVRDVLACDPGMSRNKLSKVARTCAMEDDVDERLSTLTATECRGEALCIAEEEAVAQWGLALETLSPFEHKFALNALQDTLPHNSNLALWKGNPSACKLCGERQTLLHILCNCSVAL